MKHSRFNVALTLLLTLVLSASTAWGQAAVLDDAQDKAVQILLDASRSDNALMRMHAIEGCKSVPDRALPMVQLALGDPSPPVRFAALVTAGRLQLDAIANQALELANDAEQPNYVQAAAVFAAYRCGKEEQANLGRIAEMLWDDDIRQRANAAMLLGLTGQKAALPVLQDAIKDPMPRSRAIDRDLTQLQMIEAMINLGDDDSLATLRAMAYSDKDEVRVMAVLMLGRTLDGSMEGNFIGFLAKDPIELRLAASESLARLGSIEGLPVMIQASEVTAEKARAASPAAAEMSDEDLQAAAAVIRSQAAFALGQAADFPEAAAPLVALLDDSEELVRIAAAAATLEAINR